MTKREDCDLCFVQTLLYGIPVAHIQLSLPARKIVTAAEAHTSSPTKFIDIYSGIFFRPLEDQMATEQMGMLERRICVLGLLACDEFQESEPARAVVELLGKTD